ncbi:MAG: RNA polymerase sigma-70 factor [Mariniphaga sp.]|nr:RNA polymerase sigma-70 factor [Mariniphaga sp.]
MGTAPIQYDDYFLQLFKEGNDSAFEKVFKTEYNRIVGFCQQFIGDKDVAKSLAQDTFVKLWLNREKIESINGIRSFLYTSAKTGCLNSIRHQKVISRYHDQLLQMKEGELNREILDSFDFDQLELNELEKIIDQSIAELPEKCRLVFMLSRFDGKKNSEIAEELDISIKSVEANMTRALKSLRVKLAEYLPAILVQLILGNI